MQAQLSEFINDIYLNLFNRAPDAAGKAYWTNEIATGKIAIGKAILAIANGATGDDATILNNKIAVAVDFTTDTSVAGLGFPANAAFKSAATSVLDGVGVSAASVDAGKAATDTFIAGGGGTGSTFNLTTGIDTFTGGNSADTFNAAPGGTGGTSSTFTGLDALTGGEGIDTLNITTDGTANTSFPAGATVTGIELVNLVTTAGGFGGGTVDASKFGGVTTLTQSGAAASNVTNLAATTTAKLVGIDSNFSVDTVDAATSAKIEVSGHGEGRTFSVNTGNASVLNSVTLAGTVKDTSADKTTANLILNIEAGKDVASVAVNTAVGTTLSVFENLASTKNVTGVDASASTGSITFTPDAQTASIKTGSGNDTVTVQTATLKDDAATPSTDETVSAVVSTGAGKDAVTINTSGTGTTSVDTGSEDDSVTLTADGTGKLTVALGAGADKLSGAGVVAGTDSVDGGEGTDTLLLNMVGAANIGAFSNFETFDVAGLGKTLDIDILAAKNTVTELVASADVGSPATVTNVGAGVGYRVTGDTNVANGLTLTQKAGGALTVTLDIDETGTTAATTAATNRDASVTATNATSVKAVFDSAFVGAATGAGDNATDLNITGSKATSLEVVSGGANAVNNLDFTGADSDGAAGGKGDFLTSITITGDRAATVNYTAFDFSEIATVNASGLTGALTFDLGDLKGGSGTITLGTGADVLTAQPVAATTTAALAAVTSVSGLQKGVAEDAAAQSGFDIIQLTGAVQAADVAATATHTVKDGKFTFNGTGPATLADALTLVQGVVGANEAVVFEYVGNSYVFAEGATDGAGTDTVIKLVGVTGVAGLDTVGASTNLYVI